MHRSAEENKKRKLPRVVHGNNAQKQGLAASPWRNECVCVFAVTKTQGLVNDQGLVIICKEPDLSPSKVTFRFSIVSRRSRERASMVKGGPG